MLKLKNILLIGAGPHARRIHIPIIDLIKKDAQIKCIVDLESEKSIIEDYFKNNNYIIKYKLYLDKNESIIKNNKLNSNLVFKLNDMVNRLHIDAVFISTEPSSHVAYAIWALNNGLSVLMDKPISTPMNLATSLKSINQISRDYQKIIKLYNKQKKKYPHLKFELLTQRRYHFAFLKIKDLVNEVRDRTGVPITSFQTTHCDGQWRMPSEIIEQNYHPYNQGYGKCSHSGYHSIDIMDWIVRNSICNSDQETKKIEVTSSFVYPNDFLVQLPIGKYKELFNSEEPIKYSKKEFNKKFKNYGELDAQIQLTYKNKDNKTITIGSLNLLHNSFSQRNWPSAKGRDLYKGNGRIRHELHYIVQGPFQTIIYESFQSEEILNEKTANSKVGGEYHLDIHVFRNSKMFSDWKSYQKYSIDDFDTHFLKGYSRGHQEDARREAILTFIKALDDDSVVRNSSIEDQRTSVEILKAAYKSMWKRKRKLNPIVKIKG